MEFFEIINSIKRAYRVLSIPRIEDLPYFTSPAIQYTYESTANVSAGIYTFADPPTALTPDRPVRASVLYYIRGFSFVADIDELDYHANLITTPTFQISLRSDQNAPKFREPIQMTRYFEQLTYRMAFVSAMDTDQMFGAFAGSISQGPSLVGKPSVTLKAVITAQEISDTNFVNAFRRAYPDVTGKNKMTKTAMAPNARRRAPSPPNLIG